MATTRKEIGADDELEQLKALVAEQQQRLDALEGREASPPNTGDGNDKRSTRRQLLKLAGASLAGAAGAAALRAIPASAADGNTVTVGGLFAEQTGAETAISSLGYTSTTSLFGALGGWAHAGIGVYGYVAVGGQAVLGRTAHGGVGVNALAFGTGGIGVRGYGYQYGGMFSAPAGVVTLLASSGSGSTGELGDGSTGVAGRSSTGMGVYGFTSATSSRSVYGYTSAAGSSAIQGNSPNFYGGRFTGRGGSLSVSTGSGFPGAIAIAAAGGPDLLLNGRGRLVQYWYGPGGTYGGPLFTPLPNYFETVRNRDGAMWQSRGNGSGATGQAAWKRVNAVRVDSADGTGAPYAPFRVYDSRSGAKKAAGTTTVVVIAGAGSGASSIPTDAVAIIGNLTATQYTGTGFLTISPAGVAAATSSVNFITGQGAIANSFIVGLGTGANAGKVQVTVSGHSSHILIDITGYLQ
ncbi:MAG TPA: hypothetical protein VND96_12245 [Candidatus Micrarchaeaceae archaeon]|nr:hypothetical protein [Candidatus Micrarchaeaceae archaeon]